TVTTVDHLAIWNNTTGTLLADTITPSLVSLLITPWDSSLVQALSTIQTVAGTQTGINTYLNQILINSDNLNAGNQNVFGFGVVYNCCGSGAEGQRFSFGSRLFLSSTGNAADPL